SDVRLDPEEKNDVTRRPGEVRGEKGVLGPFDPPRDPLDERHVRPRRLKVEEALGIDVAKALGSPFLGQKAAGERCPLTPVVPTAKGDDQHGIRERRPRLETQLISHPSSLRAIPAPNRAP